MSRGVSLHENGEIREIIIFSLFKEVEPQKQYIAHRLHLWYGKKHKYYGSGVAVTPKRAYKLGVSFLTAVFSGACVLKHDMRLHLLHKSHLKNVDVTVTSSLFRAACDAVGVELICHDFAKNAPKFDFVHIPTLGTDDFLYRSTQSRRAVVAERLMINSSCTTFYKQWEFACFERGTSWYIHHKIGLPVVQTIPYIPLTYVERDHLVEQLGGYPIIVKVVGNSLGVGVMRLDSRDSFNSVVDYVHSLGAPVLFRKYIDHTHYVRAIVVGDSVIASKAVYASEGEFRTNTVDAKKRTRVPIVLPEETQREVVRAVHAIGLEAGGVDLLVAHDGVHHIAEVNFPFDFASAQRVTGLDIASAMLAHLLAKASNRYGRSAFGE